MDLRSQEKNSEESRWLGSRRISRGRKSPIFLHILLNAIMKYLVIGMLTAVLLFVKALKGTTLQIDPSWILAALVFYTHINQVIVSMAC